MPPYHAENNRLRMIEMTTETHAALTEERRRETQVALDEVAAGRTVDHAEVEAWAAGFGYKEARRITQPEQE